MYNENIYVSLSKDNGNLFALENISIQEKNKESIIKYTYHFNNKLFM